MGHVRLKGLPKSRTWQKVTSLVSNGADVEKVADATIRASEKALTTLSPHVILRRLDRVSVPHIRIGVTSLQSTL